MGDELRQQSWIFDMFILDRIDRELLHSLEGLELKFGLSSEFFDKIPVRILLDVLFRVFRFSCPHIFILKTSLPSWHWEVRKVAMAILKYLEWFLCQISRTNLLLFVYTTSRKRFIIFKCRYFKLSWNTTALSQSNCSNFSCSSINAEISRQN